MDQICMVDLGMRLANAQKTIEVPVEGLFRLISVVCAAVHQLGGSFETDIKQIGERSFRKHLVGFCRLKGGEVASAGLRLEDHIDLDRSAVLSELLSQLDVRQMAGDARGN